MDQIIIHSLKAVQNVIINDRHCFECYGCVYDTTPYYLMYVYDTTLCRYDVLIDTDLKPHIHLIS